MNEKTINISHIECVVVLITQMVSYVLGFFFTILSFFLPVMLILSAHFSKHSMTKVRPVLL